MLLSVLKEIIDGVNKLLKVVREQWGKFGELASAQKQNSYKPRLNCQLSVVSCQLSVVSCQLSVVREQGIGNRE